MSKVVKEDLDQLNASLTVVIDKDSYASRFDSALKNYKHRSQLKGFRKGKTPESFLRKAYGPGILSDVINDMLQEEINNFLRDDKDTNYLGHPIPSPDQAPVSFDLDRAGDFEFKFDIGKAPDFEIIGLSADTKVARFEADITEAELEKDLLGIRRRMGKLEDVEDGVMQEDDALTIHTEELENGAHMHGGIHHHFQLRLDEDLDETLKKELMQRKVGETFTFNPFAINKEANAGYVRRYYLGLEEELDREISTEFEGRIEAIRRAELPPMDQAFFDSYFGEGVVSNEEEAKAHLRKELEQYFNRRADGLFFQMLRQQILDLNHAQLVLPDEFLKRWLVTSDEKNTPELVEKSYDRFAESLRWSLIRNKLIRDNELDVTEEEVRSEFANRIRESVGYQLDDIVISSTIDRLMGDEKQLERLAEDILEKKVYSTIEAAVGTEKKPISFKDLSEKEMALYESNAAASA
ncbi:MAG: trigger factor [Saprospirales bacterium]|nr:trigger factor [Saprospirales bacterium]